MVGVVQQAVLEPLVLELVRDLIVQVLLAVPGQGWGYGWGRGRGWGRDRGWGRVRGRGSVRGRGRLNANPSPQA